jgi:hypothetical protein
MNKSISFFIGAALLASSAVLPLAALAQTSHAMMPVLYNQSGQAVNNGTTAAVPAGTYYLQAGGVRPVEYYGNGTYYDPAIMQYGGSVHNPNGTAGADLGYVTGTGSVIAANPGVPNTGAGGDAPMNLALLFASGIVVLAGAAALTYAFSSKSRIA